ncbi:MAG: NADH-quinone oxidoreductase subunit A [Planctomycetaceae bacterium]|nr:MAG: NADH-quinone oxidoreductase subunit A [Planctomycetaceae bacterium]
MIDLVVHLLVFAGVGVLALLLPLWLGYLLRPKLPTPEKLAVYECGEPTIGSSYIQFDLRFYTVALLFIIFDVEVVFFFPWATVFGKATQLADQRLSVQARAALTQELVGPGIIDRWQQVSGQPEIVEADTALSLAWMALVDVLVFFAVLLVGFAYVWKRGDLDWVRAMTQPSRTAKPLLPRETTANAPPVLVS